MKTAFIYALNDPITGNCRYVGKADRPRKRLTDHIREAATGKTYRDCWVRSLLAGGLRPVLEILHECPFDEWPLWERAWIKASREIGYSLTNLTDGGEDPPHGSGSKNHFFGKKHTSAAIEKNKLAHLGKRISSATVEKRRLRQRVKKSSNTSGVVGVCFDKAREKWKPSLMVNRREIQLGRFLKFEDAVFVRRLAEDKYFA